MTTSGTKFIYLVPDRAVYKYLSTCDREKIDNSKFICIILNINKQAKQNPNITNSFAYLSFQYLLSKTRFNKKKYIYIF